MRGIVKTAVIATILVMYCCACTASAPSISTGKYYLNEDGSAACIHVISQNELIILDTDFDQLAHELYEGQYDNLDEMKGLLHKEMTFSLELDGNRAILYTNVNEDGGLMMTYDSKNETLLFMGEKYTLAGDES